MVTCKKETSRGPGHRSALVSLSGVTELREGRVWGQQRDSEQAVLFSRDGRQLAAACRRTCERHDNYGTTPPKIRFIKVNHQRSLLTHFFHKLSVWQRKQRTTAFRDLSGRSATSVSLILPVKLVT